MGSTIGRTYFTYFRDLTDLRPSDAVLDIGCGVGRMALPLTEYLTPPGSYDGFDIVRANVAWCVATVSPRFPHFRFRHADIFSREYNPRGTLAGAGFAFPYPAAGFDFALATSVFTHLLPADAAHYLGEIGRVLKPGGRCLATFFLLNPESDALIDAGKSAIPLRPSADGVGRIISPDSPEAGVGLSEAAVTVWATAAGLTLDRSHYGHWCGRPGGFDFQDIVVLRKS